MEEIIKKEDVVENSNEIMSLRYFIEMLQDYIKGIQVNSYVFTTDLSDEFKDIEEKIRCHIDNSKSNLLYYYKSELIDIINDMNKEVLWGKSQEKPIIVDTKKYSERAISKLNYLFRKQKILNEDEAQTLYSDYNYLNKKYQIFIELVDWINQKNISIIPDRMMFSSYLGISVDQYVYYLESTSDDRISSIFKSIDEYIITSKMNAGELGTRNTNAIKTNLSYDKVGNSLSAKETITNSTTNNIMITNEDIYKKMKQLGYKDNDDPQIKKNEIIDYTK